MNPLGEVWVTDPDGDTLNVLLADVAERFGDADAVVQGSVRLTYADWWRQAGGLAAELRDRGVVEGDIVAIGLPSSVEYAVAYAAIARLGAIATGINPRHGSAEIAHILAKSDPRIVICGGDLLGRLPVDSLDRVLAVEKMAQYVAREPGAVVHADPNAPAVIVWTSGTTGFPKGAHFNSRALRASAQGARDFVRPFDRRLVPLPFVHAGFMTKVWEIIASATALVITPVPWRASEMLEILERERITVATGVPTQWEKVTSLPNISDHDLSSLRLAITSTAPASPELIRRMASTLGCEVSVRFASTESGPATGTRPEDSPEILASTLGRPLPGAEVGIVDESGAALPANAIGSVRVRHGGRMQGYWKDDAETVKTLSSDGWIRTGDLGYLTEDGNLVISGRTTEMYIRGGYNVYPREIENALVAHPKVREVAVLGVEAPVIGEMGVAVIVPERLDDPPQIEEIRDYLRGRIADYKLPDELRIVREMPLTAFMKISRTGLRELVSQST